MTKDWKWNRCLIIRYYRFIHRDLTISHHEPGADGTSKAIADQLGGVPLAVVQMAAIIRRQSLSLKDFSDLYKEGADLYALHQFTNWCAKEIRA